MASNGACADRAVAADVPVVPAKVLLPQWYAELLNAATDCVFARDAEAVAGEAL